MISRVEWSPSINMVMSESGGLWIQPVKMLFPLNCGHDEISTNDSTILGMKLKVFKTYNETPPRLLSFLLEWIVLYCGRGYRLRMSSFNHVSEKAMAENEWVKVDRKFSIHYTFWTNYEYLDGRWKKHLNLGCYLKECETSYSAEK